MLTSDKNKVNNEFYLSILAASVMFFSPIKNELIRLLRFFIVLPWHLDTIMIYGILALIMLLSISKLILRIKYMIILIIVFIYTSLIISIIINISNFSLINSILIDFTVYSVPALLIFSALKDYSIFKNIVYYFALVFFLVFLFNFFLFGFRFTNNITYSQQDAYNLLLPSIFFYYRLSSNKKGYLLNLVLFFASIFIMIAMGARGPVAIIFAYIILKLLFSQNKHKLSLIVFFIVVSLSIVFYYDQILLLLIDVSKSLGLSTRVFEKIMYQSFWEDSTRISIFRYVYNNLSTYPFGIGLGNDRIFISSNFNIYEFNQIKGMYVHNVLLEILFAYGFFVGSIILLFMTTLLYKSLMSTVVDYRSMLVIFIFVGLIPLMFSGSFINSPLFFALIGFSLSLNNFKRSRGKHL